jgi:hypothetical protein
MFLLLLLHPFLRLSPLALTVLDTARRFDLLKTEMPKAELEPEEDWDKAPPPPAKPKPIRVKVACMRFNR